MSRFKRYFLREKSFGRTPVGSTWRLLRQREESNVWRANVAKLLLLESHFGTKYSHLVSIGCGGRRGGGDNENCLYGATHLHDILEPGKSSEHRPWLWIRLT
jgi:hypothetical protein